MAPFQFAMNDVYLRDTSRKVKQTLNTKRNNGKYVACPPYGYRKAERTTDQLVPDENTAPVVKMIFDMAGPRPPRPAAASPYGSTSRASCRR